MRGRARLPRRCSSLRRSSASRTCRRRPGRAGHRRIRRGCARTRVGAVVLPRAGGNPTCRTCRRCTWSWCVRRGGRACRSLADRSALAASHHPRDCRLFDESSVSGAQHPKPDQRSPLTGSLSGQRALKGPMGAPTAGSPSRAVQPHLDTNASRYSSSIRHRRPTTCMTAISAFALLYCRRLIEWMVPCRLN